MGYRRGDLYGSGIVSPGTCLIWMVIFLILRGSVGAGETRLMPVEKDRSFPCAVIYWRDDSMQARRGPKPDSALELYLAPPSVRYALWPDGTLIWSEGHARGGTGPGYVIGRVSPGDVRQFYQGVEASLEKYAVGRERSEFAPDAARMALVVLGASLPISMQTSHEPHDEAHEREVAGEMARRRKTAEAGGQAEVSPADRSRAQRALWWDVKVGMKGLVAKAQVQSTTSEEIFAELKRIDVSTIPLLSAAPALASADGTTTETMRLREGQDRDQKLVPVRGFHGFQVRTMGCSPVADSN